MHQWKYAQFNVIFLRYFLWSFTLFLLSDFYQRLVQIILWSNGIDGAIFLDSFDNVEALYNTRNLDIFCLFQEYMTSSFELENFS